MSNKPLFRVTIFLSTVVLISSAAFAGQTVKEILRLENTAYSEHKDTIVIFNHQKHQKDHYIKYPEFFASPCGECHHDKENKKLVNLKEGDEVQNFIECHKKPYYLKGKDSRGLIKKQRRENHGNAMHDTCKGSHKKYNKPRNLRPKDKGYAPNTCITCHDVNKENLGNLSLCLGAMCLFARFFSSIKPL
jgi:hypothetical protein